MSDYQKIASAIEYIQQQQHSQPSLDDIAAHVHLSAYHFQRLFSRWAGVTPKRFLQALTLQHAKKLLTDGAPSTLQTSNDIGLSSSSRLYDHFVQLEAVTPSEFKNKGEGLSIEYACHDTPFGEIFIAVTPRGICKLSFINNSEANEPLNALQSDWPKADIDYCEQNTKSLIQQIFECNPAPNKPISLWVKGTNFQVNVWRALLALKPGELSSYGRIASAIGKSTASRAVGSAIGANPIALVIPCHRVIQQSGGLGGYRWGVVRKQAILAKETA